jgi:hypothetical protein
MVFGTTEDSTLMNLHLKVASLTVRMAYITNEKTLSRWKMEKLADSRMNYIEKNIYIYRSVAKKGKKILTA